METFARALVRGAVVLGTESVVELVSGWVRGERVLYCMRAILNGDGILGEPLSPMAGVLIESLPFSADQVSDYLPKGKGRSPSDYLGRMVVTIDHSANPPLFLPKDGRTVQASRLTGVPGADVEAACDALSLEAGTHLEPAFFWTDFKNLAALQLTRSDMTWSVGRGYFRGPSNKTFSIVAGSIPGVTSLENLGDHGLSVDEEALGRTLTIIASKTSDKLRTTVSRWSKSMDSAARLEDRFIDLRIALESLYLKDFINETTSQEMRFRLSIFGAWHLGADYQERGSIRKRLRDAYDAASGAVHTGHIDFTQENHELLSDGQDLCRRGIVRLIRDGEPSDWGNSS